MGLRICLARLRGLPARGLCGGCAIRRRGIGRLCGLSICVGRYVLSRLLRRRRSFIRIVGGWL